MVQFNLQVPKKIALGGAAFSNDDEIARANFKKLC